MMNEMAVIGEYVDRKRTLPRRVLNLSLRLSSLQPGRYVFVVEVTPDQQLKYEEARLPIDKKANLC